MRNVFLLVIVLSAFLPFLAKGQQTYQLGLKFSDFEYKKVPKRYFSVRGVTSLPSSFSLKKYCPKPLNQLDLKTSSGWAAGYAALTIIQAQRNGWTGADITKNASAPIYLYFKAKTTDEPGSQEDVTLAKTLEALKRYGTPKFRELPSRSIDKVSSRIEQLAAQNRISEYARLYETNASKQAKLKAIKTTLKDNLPVVVAMHISKSFFYAKEFWHPREIFSKDLPGHALTIIGYDNSKYGGSFEVMNSWGTEWGNEGFMWIRYDDFIEFSEYAYDIYVIPGKTSGVELGGSIELKLVADNSDMAITQVAPGYYKLNKSYPSKTQFTIKITNESPAFIYAFASDLTGEVFRFFPLDNTSSVLSKAASFYVPSEDQPAEVDETLGTDYLCVLFSKEDIDIDGLIADITVLRGSFIEKVEKALGSKLISFNEIAYEKNRVAFKMNKSPQSVVMLIAEHDHR